MHQVCGCGVGLKLTEWGMDYDHTISGLLRKRNELAQAIERSEREIAGLRSDVAAIDAALKVFGVMEAPRPPKGYERRFRRGELQKIILSELRIKPMSAPDLVEAAMKRKGMEADSRKALASVSESAANALRRMEGEGWIARDGEGWRVI